MNELPLQHAAAARWATIMLGAAIVAVALTLVVFVLPRPEVKAPQITTQGAAPVKKAEKRLPWEGVKTDWSRLAADSKNFNAPEVAAHEKDVEEQLRKAREEANANQPAGAGAKPPEATGGFAPNWRFLGAVIDGERKTALIVTPEADGQQRQRFVAEGFKKDEYTVVGIEPTKLTVEQGRRRHEIGIAANTRGQGIVAGSAVPPLRTSGQSLGGAQPGARPASERVRDLRQPNRPNPNTNPNANPGAPTAPGAYTPPAQPGAQDPNAVPPLPRDPDPPGTR